MVATRRISWGNIPFDTSSEHNGDLLSLCTLSYQLLKTKWIASYGEWQYIEHVISRADHIFMYVHMYIHDIMKDVRMDEEDNDETTRGDDEIERRRRTPRLRRKKVMS